MCRKYINKINKQIEHTVYRALHISKLDSSQDICSVLGDKSININMQFGGIHSTAPVKTQK